MIDMFCKLCPPKIKRGALLFVLLLCSHLIWCQSSDVDLLSRLITSECSVCTTAEKYLVGSVVLNRVDSDRFPNTVGGVVKQSRQFDGYTSKWFIRTAQSDKIARDLLKGKNRLNGIYFFVNEKSSSNDKFVEYIKKGDSIKGKHHTFKIGI